MKIREGNDVPEHLAQIMKLWNHIKVVCCGQKSKQDINEQIAYLLPCSWDNFTWPYLTQADKMTISIYGLIGECNEEFQRQQQHEKEQAQKTANIYTSISKAPLAKCIGGYTSSQIQNTNQTKNSCFYCGCDNHKKEECYYFLKKTKMQPMRLP